MTARWIAAAAGAVALAIFTLPNVGSSIADIAAFAPADGAACDPKAKPANLTFSMKDMHGKDVRLSDYKGKVILLNFWATWCGPCKVEIPAFVELSQKYRDKGLVVLGVSVDDPAEKLKPFAEKFKMNYPVLIGLGRDEVQEAYGPIWGIPSTAIIGRNGLICKRHMGAASKEQFEREIKALL